MQQRSIPMFVSVAMQCTAQKCGPPWFIMSIDIDDGYHVLWTGVTA